MKKILFIALTIASAIILLTSCSNNDETFAQKNYETDATQIQEVNIDVHDRKIEVSLSGDNQIHIDYFESSKEYYDISISDDNVLIMTAKNNKEWKDYVGGKSAASFRKISLQVPDAVLSNLMLSTTNEDILLSALRVNNDIFLSANGGNITFDKVNVGNELNLTEKNGDIKGSIIGSYDDFAIMCKTKKGESNLPAEKKDGIKKLQVSSNNGKIDVQFVQN